MGPWLTKGSCSDNCGGTDAGAGPTGRDKLFGWEWRLFVRDTRFDSWTVQA